MCVDMLTPSTAPLSFQGRWDDPSDFLEALFYGSEGSPDPQVMTPDCVDWKAMALDMFHDYDSPFAITAASDGGVYVFGVRGRAAELAGLYGEHMPAAVAQGAPAAAWLHPCRGSVGDDGVQEALSALLCESAA